MSPWLRLYSIHFKTKVGQLDEEPDAAKGHTSETEDQNHSSISTIAELHKENQARKVRMTDLEGHSSCQNLCIMFMCVVLEKLEHSNPVTIIL